MSVTKNVSLETKIKFLDRFPAVVTNMDIHEDGAAADPYLPM